MRLKANRLPFVLAFTAMALRRVANLYQLQNTILKSITLLL